MKRSNFSIFPWKIFLRWSLTQFFLVLLAITLSALGARHFFKQSMTDQVRAEMLGFINIISKNVPHTPNELIPWCKTQLPAEAHFRVTLISENGNVLCDSHHTREGMENHLKRPEILEAIEKGVGTNIRESATIHIPFLYIAKKVSESKTILRIALPLSDLEALLNRFDRGLILFLSLGSLALLFAAFHSTRSLIQPISHLMKRVRSQEDSQFLEQEAYGEFSELERSLDFLQKDLAKKKSDLGKTQGSLQSLLGSISDAVLAIDPEEAVLFANPRFLELWPETRSTQRLRDIFRSPEIIKSFKETLLLNSPSPVTTPLKLETARGSRYFRITAAALRESDNKNHGAFCVFHDVSDMKIAEQIRIDFVANVSHELRTPLTSIQGYTETLIADLKKGVAPDPAFLETIRKNSTRLLTLMDDLLDLSALDSGEGITPAYSKISLKELMESVQSQCEPTLQAKKQTLEVEFLTPEVLGDRQRLEQILFNLITNANKYTPEGSRIEVHWDTQGENWTRLRVSDNGPGIAPEHLPRLFERFYRVDKSRSREVGGTGLGLAIVKHIVLKHGGKVNAESELGKGTTFTCLFPRIPSSPNGPS